MKEFFGCGRTRNAKGAVKGWHLNPYVNCIHTLVGHSRINMEILVAEFDMNEIKYVGNTLTSVQKDNLLYEPLRIPQATDQGYVEVEPGSLFDGSYPNSKTHRGRVQNNGQCSPTLTACGAGGGMTPMLTDAELETTKTKDFIEQVRGHQPMNYRIRKLTPRECFRLMGVSESDIDKISQCGVSQSQQYKMAGNSIVVDVLEQIFRKLFVDKEQESQQLRLF